MNGDWNQVVRFDHNPANPNGHDITEEGLHMDVYRDSEKVWVKDDFPAVPLIHAPRDMVSCRSSSTLTNCSGGSNNGAI